jgi:hypothetical protein
MNRLDRYIIQRWLMVFFPALMVLMAAYLTSEAAVTVWEHIRKGIAPTVIPLLFGAWFIGLLSGGVDSASAYTEPLIGGHIVEHSIYVLGALCVAQGVVSIFAQLRVKSGT